MSDLEICGLISELLDVPVEDFDRDTNLSALGDSLDMLTLTHELERRLTVRLPDKRLEQLHTVGDVIDLVNSVVNYRIGMANHWRGSETL